jgi:2-polyprenyl-3-methyl-5-hydroxy-6-metoxy-1,4-benzoquinol methylase
MKYLMYENWTNKRIDAIVKQFGEDSFNRAKVLEMGACHGDIGIELMKLGANVTFSDVRFEHMKDIPNKIGFEPEMICIDHNSGYKLNRKFDFVLHMSLLCHIEKWKEDLNRVVELGGWVILETIVNPNHDQEDMLLPSDEHEYSDYNSNRAYVTERSIESELKKLKCTFFQLNVENTNYGWVNRNTMVRHHYKWNGSTEPIKKEENGINLITHYRRMWAIRKVDYE